MREITNAVISTFKKDLSNLELKGIKGALDTVADRWVHENVLLLYKVPHDRYNLVYTTTSTYARYVASEPIWLTTYLIINHFTVTTDGILVMVCYGTNGNIYYYELELTDYF